MLVAGEAVGVDEFFDCWDGACKVRSAILWSARGERRVEGDVDG